MIIDLSGTSAEIQQLKTRLDNLADVANTGSYTDLTDKPVITEGTIIIDTAMDGTSENVVQNKVIKEYVDDAIEGTVSPAELATELAKKANKDGYYEQLTAGFAENLTPRGDGIGAQFTRRRTAGSLDTAGDAAAIKSIHGKTLIWNQLVENADFSSSALPFAAGAGVTISVTDGIFKITALASGLHNTTFVWDKEPIIGHKYLSHIRVRCHYTAAPQSGILAGFVWRSSTNATLGSRYGEPTTSDVWCDAYCIRVVDGTEEDFGIRMNNSSTVGDYLEVDTANVFDLTQMGIADQISTPADFEALFPNAYYAYNAGTPITFKGEKIVTNGFNQWDEEWEAGSYDTTTGEKVSASARIRSKNFIKILPNTNYYVKGPLATLYMLWYDSNKNFISAASGINTQRTSPTNAYYATFVIGSTSTPQTTYNHDICINFSNASLNGTYKPYEEHELSLPVGISKTYTGADGQQHTWVGLDSAGTAYDEQTPTKDIKRIGVVDLGSFMWGKSSPSGRDIFFTNGYVDGIKPSSLNLLIDGYIPSNGGSSVRLGEVSCITTGRIYIGVKSGTFTPDTFKSAMAGVLLFYELAEPVETAVPERNFNYVADDMGTESLVPEGVDANGVPKTTPFTGMIAYLANAADFIHNAPKNFQSQESMDAMLAALGTALGFTYTKTWDSTNNKWNYIITPNS